ncbi:MAG: hypothetical protein ACOCTI_01185 [Phycisphaeraceae bacterium]
MNAQTLPTLILLNVILLAALAVALLQAPEAKAQLPRGNRYAMVSGEHPDTEDSDVVYIVNLTTGQVVALSFDYGDQEFEYLTARDIPGDIGAAGRPGR